MMRGDLSALVVMNRGGGERGLVGRGPWPCFQTALHVAIADCAPRLDGSPREVRPRVRYLILGRLVGDVHDVERAGTELDAELMRGGNRRHGNFGVRIPGLQSRERMLEIVARGERQQPVRGSARV